MKKPKQTGREAKNPLDMVTEKPHRGPKPAFPSRWVFGRAGNYRVSLEEEWDRLWPRLSQAQTEDDVISAFREVYTYEHELMPHQAPVILKVLMERSFPKRRKAQIGFIADSVAGLGKVSPRTSRDICAKERARTKRTTHVLRYEFYIECSCKYGGNSLNHACPLCGAKIVFPVNLGSHIF